MSNLYVPGWIDDPVEAARVRGIIESEQGSSILFSDYPIAGSGDNDKTVLLWEPELKLYGNLKPSWNQGQVGSCVSFGWGRNCNDLFLQMVATGKSDKPPGDVATEPIYGGSRYEVGGGQLSGDGSLGSWAAKWVRDWGILFRTTYGSIDLTSYSESRCRQYGARGCPDELEPIAREHPVKTVALVRSADEAWSALGSFYGIPICSDQGFTTTLVDGFCQASGSWAHCMAVRGRIKSRKYGRAFVIQNSWGNYLGGDRYIEDDNGQRIQLPEGAFGCRWETMDRILRQQDSYVISNAVGFPIREELDWVF